MSKNSDRNHNKKRQFQVKDMVLIGAFAAVIAVIAQVTIPLPSGIPITLQTFAVALTGFCLGRWKGIMATVVYILIGLIGIPVFSGFGGGPAVLFGLTGGFIWGFLPLVFACGCWEVFKKKWISIIIGILGLCVCHILGVLQLSVVGEQPLWSAFFFSSLPFIVKDVISLISAYGLAIPIHKFIMKMN